MTTLTNDQIENIQEQIIQLSDKYLGKTLGDPNTLPLIEEVRNALQTEYPDVKVNLTYTAATKSTSVDALINGTKISVVFTSPKPDLTTVG